MLRIDRTVWPTVFRGATLSILEVEALSTIKDVVRKGRVRRIERDAIVLEKGTVDAAPDDLYVDCTAKAFSRRPPVAVFNGEPTFDFDPEETSGRGEKPQRPTLSDCDPVHNQSGAM